MCVCVYIYFDINALKLRSNTAIFFHCNIVNK